MLTAVIEITSVQTVERDRGGGFREETACNRTALFPCPRNNVDWPSVAMSAVTIAPTSAVECVAAALSLVDSMAWARRATLVVTQCGVSTDPD